MGRVVVFAFVVVAAIAMVRILAPLLAIGAVALVFVAWRWPDLIGRVLGDRRLERVPQRVRATPMRFAATVATLTLVTATAASAIGAPAAADEVASVSPSVRASAEPTATPTDEPTPRSTPRRTPRATPSPRSTPTPQPTATPAPTPVFGREPTGPTQVAVVASVTDGDTIRVILDGQNLPVRYIGIDTPETQNGFEWMGREAADANVTLVAGREVVLEKDVSETDQYGRLLRHVWVQTDAGWTLVGLELLRLGYAQVTTYPPDVKYVDELFLPVQQAAREDGLGLWGAPPTPTPAPIAPLVPAPPSNCEPSYPDICIQIGIGDLDCPDISARRFRVLWNVPNPDPHRFDGDGDGIGCES